jgi:hypothetical protein
MPGVATTVRALKETWIAVTSFESTKLQLLVIGIAGVVGVVVSWEGSELWTRLFGYSDVLTYLTTVGVFLVLYFSLSYAVSSLDPSRNSSSE